MQGHCYPLLYRYNISKMSVLFLQIRIQPLKQKSKSIVFHSNSLPKLSFRLRPQQPAVYTSGPPFLTPYVSLFMPHTLINQAQNCELLLRSLQKQCLNVHNILYKHVVKTYIILIAKSNSSSLPLQPCVLKFKVQTSKNKK